jgi:hypothetical protein
LPYQKPDFDGILTRRDAGDSSAGPPSTAGLSKLSLPRTTSGHPAGARTVIRDHLVDMDSRAFVAWETGKEVKATSKKAAKALAAEQAVSLLKTEGYGLPYGDNSITQLKIFGEQNPGYEIRYEITQTGRSFLCVYLMGKRIIGSGGVQGSVDE